MELLKAQGIRKTYTSKVAVEDFSLTVKRGEAVGLLGSNGAGKTTSLHMLAGILRPDRGRVWLEGQSIYALEQYPADDVRTTANLWNDGVSMVEEDRHSTPYFYEVLYENIVANPEREILEILKFCELPEVDRSNRPFWNQISQVGVVRHTNRYGNFALIEKICRNHMKRYGYLPG